MNYQKKYLEYKKKYYLLKQTGGMPPKSKPNKAELSGIFFFAHEKNKMLELRNMNKLVFNHLKVIKRK